MSKRNIGLVVLLVVSFWSGSIAEAQSQQYSLEQRVQNLESELKFQRQENGGYRSQFVSWVSGNFFALLHSTSNYNTYFQFNSQLGPTDTTYAGMPIENAVIVLRVGGQETDKVDLSQIVKPGDMVIAWMDKNPSDCSPSHEPCSPDFWHVWAYYWNKESGLAIAIIHIDGMSQGAVIVK